MIELRNVSKSYGTGATAVTNLSLLARTGKITALVGPSGCGKTTLLRLIAAQLRPHAGEVLVNGQNLPQLSRGKLFEARKQFGVLFQSGALFTDMNVFENVAFPLRVHTQLNDELIRDIVLMKLQAVGLRGAIELMPDELSGGMKRRLLVAQALVHKPPVIVLDEPTAGVDVELRQTLWQFVRSLNQKGHTVVLTTHYLEEAEALCQRIAMLKDGRVIALDRTSALLARATAHALRFKTDAALPPALAANARVTGRIVELPAQDSAEIEQHLRTLREAGIAAEDVEVRKADLEDVFIDLMHGQGDYAAARTPTSPIREAA